MGFDLDRFEGPVDPDLICKLCGKVLEDPLSTPCGHVFCAACALRWFSKVSSCPALCQKITTKELNHVLPLKNLILKLDVKCEHRERGCNRVMKLQHLSEHAETCDFSPVRCRNEGCDAVLILKDVASHMRERCEHRAVEVCQGGCGLALSLKERSDDHSCLQALKTHSCLLQTKALRLEEELKSQSLSFSKRERSLLSKLSALHCELHITALTFQKKITEYKSRIDSLSNRCLLPLEKGEDTRSLKVTLHRTSGSLGFSIIGGRLCEEPEEHEDFSDGIYISKIVENGAAEKAGLHVHDRIIEVNGRSLSITTHDQAVEAFQAAKDPIEVKVLRRPVHKTLNTHEPAQRVDNSTQTNVTMKYMKHIETMAKLPSPPAPLCMAVLDSFHSPSQCQMARRDSTYSTDLHDGVQKDIESSGLEYEEVDLQRKTTNDKLGLMLCYKTDDETTAIFISEIAPEGIAAKDGRLQEGDQIIQINGVKIQSHEEAVTLLTEAESKNVTLLVARPESQDVSWLEKDRNNLADDLHTGMLEQQHNKSTHEEDGGTTDTATLQSNHHEKDSGVGRTDESTRNDESSEQDNLGDDQNSLCDTLPENHKTYSQGTFESGDMHLSNDSFLLVDNGDSGNFLGIPGMACERFQKQLELKCLVNGSGLQGFLEHDNTLYGKRVSVDCDDQEVQMLNEELLNIELECLSIIRAHRLQTEGDDRQAKKCCTKHLTEQINTKVDQDLINNQVDYEGSTSAYNTGESCWSLHPALESDSPDSQRMAPGDKSKGSPMHRRNSTTACSKHQLSPIQEISPTKSLPGDPEVTNQGGRKQSKKRNPSLHHSSHKKAYIPAHAQHYQSYMQLIQQSSAVEYVQSQVSLASLETTPTKARPKMGWRVKIRGDGTRYITKRPIRDQLLKERALRIREERCSATTDDDATSELKLGRYWNKEERKQHAALAREQRQRRELVKQCHLENKGQTGAMNDKEKPDIIQLSRKKMLKRRNKRIFDSWMTIQELLTHGTKSTDGNRLYNSFLSVTTV
ncbi:E3 ubiquitin-protein ligase PDZRN3-B [Pimephales promelas]|uniref:E3 ubiquitin-protein ligase PDZRN3-B n=1 Tax=Pimephales promelas TaxID=90988 RepID=UPI001955AC77|nr:E3 ubiquitin-protein ligase PDZRN3-B [Pimephales promelas]KAG1962068.1 E3 ubiquitin-protein ligase PDZRN3 [Pimephales promelas]